MAAGEQAIRTVLRLTQDAADPTHFELPTVGTIRAGGWFGGKDASFTAGGTTWSCVGRGLAPFQRFEAQDGTGAVCGRARAGLLGRVRGLEWNGQSYALAVEGRHQRRNFLECDGRDLCEVTATGAPLQPVRVVLLGDEPIPPGLLLFVVSLVRRFDRRSTLSNLATGGGGSGGCGGGCGGS